MNYNALTSISTVGQIKANFIAYKFLPNLTAIARIKHSKNWHHKYRDFESTFPSSSTRFLSLASCFLICVYGCCGAQTNMTFISRKFKSQTSFQNQTKPCLFHTWFSLLFVAEFLCGSKILPIFYTHVCTNCCAALPSHNPEEVCLLYFKWV